MATASDSQCGAAEQIDCRPVHPSALAPLRLCPHARQRGQRPASRRPLPDPTGPSQPAHAYAAHAHRARAHTANTPTARPPTRHARPSVSPGRRDAMLRGVPMPVHADTYTQTRTCRHVSPWRFLQRRVRPRGQQHHERPQSVARTASIRGVVRPPPRINLLALIPWRSELHKLNLAGSAGGNRQRSDERGRASRR